MGLGVSRSEHGEAEEHAKRAGSGVQATADDSGPRGEMKQMEPRRDGAGATIERLEHAVTRLVAGQDALIARIDSLEKALAERGRRIGDLEGRITASEEKRARALDRLDSLIGQLDELEGRAESAASLAVDPQ